MARWKNINGVLQKIAGSVRIDQVLNKLSRNAISNKAVSEKFETVDGTLDTHQDAIDGINTTLTGLYQLVHDFQATTGTLSDGVTMDTYTIPTKGQYRIDYGMATYSANISGAALIQINGVAHSNVIAYGGGIGATACKSFTINLNKDDAITYIGSKYAGNPNMKYTYLQITLIRPIA